MAVEANVNTARLWSFDKPLKRVATYVKAKVAGFYCINGESLIEFPEKNKAEDFTAFLRRIREANSEKLNISLVYLPPYSPDLNPIENVWKSVKRAVSERSPLNVEELKEAIVKLSKKLTESISFAKRWIEKFLGDKFRMLCSGL